MNKNKLDILVIFGGVSPEHKISGISAASVIENLDKEKYNISVIGISRDGKWSLTNAESKMIASGEWESKSDNMTAFVSPDRRAHGIYVIEPGGAALQKHIDAVFPVLHGQNGEDGTMQGLLECAGLPYVGPGVGASACGMDKSITKLVAGSTDVRQADFVVTDRYEFSEDPDGIIKKINEHFKGSYPLFVKPAGTGSSVGISKVKDIDGLFGALKKALDEDHKVLTEEAISGREIEVAVLGNRNARASAIGEILAANDFYDYEAKYENNNTETRIVTDIPQKKEEEIQQAAVDIYKALGCKGMSRVDFFLTDDGEVVFNEINTIPGFTSISMYPQLWQASGLSYRELLDKLIMLALDETE